MNVQRIIIYLSLLLGSLIFLFKSVQAKSFLDSLQYQWTMGVGKTMKHSQQMTFDMPDRSYSASFNVIYQTTGRKEWHKNSHFPKVGFNLHYINYNNPSLLGHGIGFTPTVILPIFEYGQLNSDLTLGMGLGIVTQPHSRTNQENTAIGSHPNNFSTVQWNVNYALDTEAKHQIGTKFKFLHVSNAAYKIPNLGLNDASVQLAYTYQPAGKLEKPERVMNDWSWDQWWKKSKIHVKYLHSWTQKYPSFGPRYLMRGGQITWAQPYSSFKDVQLGYHFEYNNAVYSFLKSIYEYAGEERKHSIQQSIFVGHEFKLGFIGVVTQVGYYTQTHYLNDKKFYQRLGGNFYIWENDQHWLKSIYISGILKTHFTVAEFAEFGVGVHF